MVVVEIGDGGDDDEVVMVNLVVGMMQLRAGFVRG